ncbi:hypothetical protein AAZX31_13G012600 [Glycine max]|uniref:HhH-GPD domain-containing protein n=1 Tax=Glycine soja TaxID=3848 RepID=A0A0B2RRP1_GLYSO|nr:hypothetical protein JHK87_034983 [Glycine soja]KHN34477.1 hypothetical protein glysoja_038896 [Glycine soja]
MEESFSKSKCLLYLPLGSCKSSFNLEKTVCNHGFFMMAPNKWISSTKSLQRPLRLADQCSSVIVTISHLPESANIQIYVHDMEGVSLKSEQAILKQVARMLRISDKDEKAVNEFQGLYPQAKQDEFGRIFRSPSLFEDVVKSILLCKCTWGKTLNMVKSLCELQLQLSSGPRSNRKKQCKTKRKRGQNNATSKKNHGIGNFPNSKELVKFGETILRERCKVGYRAQFIIKLAQSVEKGTLVLEKLEMECNLWSYKVVHRKLSELKGFGPFVVATILMCMGCYEKVPVDSETKRHLNQAHGISSCNSLDVEEFYKTYAPFQCIAFWFELLQSYEKDHGKLSELDESDYPKITGSQFLQNEENAPKS